MGEGHKIAIVIDDEEYIRNLLDTLLSQLGYETRLYASPLELPCINTSTAKHCLIDDTVPDVLMTDIQMPEMNGVELVKRMKEIGCKIDKIALMTGCCTDTLNDASQELGCQAFQKPFNIYEIQEWLTN